MARDSKPQPKKPDDDKAERLARQLRANLRRRKAQANARRQPDETSADTTPTTPPAASADEGTPDR